jgi:hypothetical protein
MAALEDLLPELEAAVRLLEAPPLPDLLNADRVIHAPGEIDRAQRITDGLARLRVEYFGGIRLIETPLVKPGYVLLFAGKKWVGTIKPEDK